MKREMFYGMAESGLVAVLQLYQHTLSILLGPCCRFTPSCSCYAISAVRRFGAMRGTCLALKRLVKCHPFHPGGYDPVPEIRKNS